MPDKFNNDTAEQLIKYMDNELNINDRIIMEKLLQTNTALQHAAHSIKPAAKIIKPKLFFKTFMRVAAVFFIAAAGYAVFLYSSTSGQSVYNNNFIAYHLPSTRGSETVSNLNALYNNGNYNDVIKSFSFTQPKTQQAYFLAAQSYLQLNKTTDAINAFKAVETVNANSSVKYYEQETDYYLMLAYIKNGEIQLAEQKLDKITSNKQHLFYKNAKSISKTKLQILKWKN